MERLFRRTKVSHSKSWRSLVPFSFLKGTRDDDDQTDALEKLASQGEKLAAKADALHSKFLESLDHMKRTLRESVDTTYRPWTLERRLKRPNTSVSWTTSLVFANVIMYGLQIFLPSITRAGTKRSDLILRGKELHRLFTPIFLHGK
jgi:hypothetical protein